MYERSYGYKYAEGGSDSTTAIAKRIRADIKEAIKDGLLPKHYKYSVRSEYFSGGSSIDVRVSGANYVQCPGSYNRTPLPSGGYVGTACGNWNCQRNEPGHMILDPEGQAAKLTLERIHGAYNHDGSDSMVDYFDVNYYGHVEFEDAESTAWRAAEATKQAARKAAVETATAHKRLKVYGRVNHHVHLAAVISGDGTKSSDLRLVCGAVLYRKTFKSFVPDETTLTCSRCAKAAARLVKA